MGAQAEVAQFSSALEPSMESVRFWGSHREARTSAQAWPLPLPPFFKGSYNFFNCGEIYIKFNILPIFKSAVQ